MYDNMYLNTTGVLIKDSLLVCGCVIAPVIKQ